MLASVQKRAVEGMGIKSTILMGGSHEAGKSVCLSDDCTDHFLFYGIDYVS
jgi:hypothetical protein